MNKRFGGILVAMAGAALMFGCGSDDVTVINTAPQQQIIEFMVLPNFSANTISVRGINSETGRTQHLSSNPTGTAPRMARTHPTTNLIYVANSGSNNITGLILDGNGGTNNTPGSPYAGPTGATNIVIHPSGRWLYAAGDNQIRGYTINADGSLTAIAGSTLALPQNAEFDGGFSNGGAFLHIPLNNSVQTFGVNSQTGALVATTNNAVAAGSLRDLSVHSSGQLLLATVRVAGANNDQVLPFSVDANGVLTAQATNNLGFDVGFSETARNGQFYVGNDAAAQIHGFNVGANGALTAIAGSPFASPGGGLYPRLDPTNSLLYSVSNAGNTVAGQRRLADGSLAAADSTPAADNLSNPAAFDFFQFVR